MSDKIGAAEVLRVAYERDPFDLDPDEMIDYLKGAIKASLRLLGHQVVENETLAEYPSHAAQLASDNHSDYLGDDLDLKCGW